jgi:hypothetical protein
MRRKLPALLAAVALVIGVVLFFQLSHVSARGGSGSPIYSTRRHDPHGTAALYLLLSESGRPARVLDRSQLPSGNELILIQALTTEDSRFEPKALLDWVAEGNTLVQLSRHQTDLAEKAGLQTQNAERLLRDEFDNLIDLEELETQESLGMTLLESGTIARIVDPRWASLGELELTAPTFFDVDPAGELWSPVAKVDERVVACSRKHGLGEIILVGTPSLVGNQSLGSEGNLDFLLSIIGSRETLLDDWSHGLGRSGTLMGLIRDFGLMPLVLQILLLVGLYAWSGQGETPPVVATDPRTRSSAEQIQTLGYLYQESSSIPSTVEMATGEIRRRLARVLQTTPHDIESAIQLNRSKYAPAANTILQRLNEAGTGSAHQVEARLMELLSSSQQLLAEVDVERRFRS